MYVELLTRGVYARIYSLDEMGPDQLDIVIGLGRLHFELLDSIQKYRGRRISAQPKHVFDNIGDFLEEVAGIVGYNPDTIIIFLAVSEKNRAAILADHSYSPGTMCTRPLS